MTAIQHIDHDELSRCLFEESNDALFIFDPQHNRVLDANPTAERLTGFRRKQLIGKPLADLFGSENGRGIEELVQAYQTTGVFHSQEGFSLKCCAADMLLVNLSVSRIHIKPNPLGLVVARDITKRKRIEQTLQQAHAELETRVSERTEELHKANAVLRDQVSVRERAEQKLKQSEQLAREQIAELELLYRTAPVGLALMDTNLRYVRINDALAAMNGRSAAEHIGQTVRQLIPGIADDVEPTMRQVIETGEPARNWEVHGATAAEPNIEKHWVGSYYPLHSQNGDVLGISVVILDITERIQAGEALEQSKDRLRMIVDSALDAVITIDAGGLITGWNPQAEAIFGWSSSEALGRELAATIIPPRERASHRAGLKRYLTTGAGAVMNRRVEMTAQWRDGTEFPVELTIAALRLGDKRVFCGFIRDISERKRVEEAARTAQQKLFEQQQRETERVALELAKVRDELVQSTRLATVGKMSAQIAHDIRSPLGAILNSVYFLKRTVAAEPSKWREALDLIEEEAYVCNRIISNLLEATRARPPQRETVDLGILFGEAGRRLQRPSEVRLEFSFAPDPFMVHVDPVQFRQVIDNLLKNALDAVGQTGEITIRASRSDEYDTVIVEDTGPGIPLDQRESVFEFFFTTKAQGTGLGLAICRRIVAAHNGIIQIIDKPELGTAFEIRLPRETS